jgi:hypothetical protein
MTDNRLFYYPYATMFDAQLPLLKTAALYFDKLFLLDPRDATWDLVGPDPRALDEVLVLERHGLLERVSPTTVFENYSSAFAQAVREDVRDPEFADGQLRSMLGEMAPRLANEMAHRIDQYAEHRQALSYLPGNEDSAAPGQEPWQSADYSDFSSKRQVYDEVRSDSTGNILNYRYIEVPLALGEAIMVNHALFAGLLLSQATPIADDPFHAKILARKLRRTMNNPLVRQILDDRIRERGLRSDLLAMTALPDADLDLPALGPGIPVEAVLEYRQEHADELSQVRDHLAALARRIENDPWTDGFARELDHHTIPDLRAELDGLRQRRDDWGRKRKYAMLSAAGLAVGAGTAILTIFAAPVTPIVLAIAGLSLVSGSAIPGIAMVNSWREGRAAGHENGLSYLLHV